MKNQSLHRAGMAVLLLLLGGCAQNDDIVASARLREVDELGALSDAQALVRSAKQQMPSSVFWRALGDTQLDELVDTALAGSASIKVADLRIRRAAALTDMAQSALYPRVAASLDTLEQRFSEKSIWPPPLAGSYDSNNRWVIDANIDLDLWGKYRSALKGATAERQAAEIEAQAARITVATGVARAWVEFDRLCRQRDQLGRMIEARLAVERLQVLRAQAGLDPDFDRTAERRGVASLRTELAQIEERIGLQRNLLAALADRGPEYGAHLAEPKIDGRLDVVLPSVLPSDLLAGRPDISINRLRVESMLQNIEVAKTDFYPSVNLRAFAGLESIGLDSLFNSGARILGIGPLVKIPIFDAGRLRANLKIKTADYDAAVEEYNASLVAALRDVADQLRTLSGIEQQSVQAGQALSAVRRGETLAGSLVKQGIASQVRLLNAHLQVLTQERVDIDLRARRFDTALSLERALGGGFVPEQSPFRMGNPESTEK